MEILKLSKVSKIYNDQEVVKKVSFSLKNNETISIIGPSGSGKTTILRMIQGLDKPSSGEILFHDKKLTNFKKIGILFQNFHLFPHMDIITNLTFAPMNVLKIKEKEAKEKAMDLLSNLNLDHKKSEYPKNLSGGQKQRVALARTLMMDPEIILLDEPTSALDPEIIRDVIRLVDGLKIRNISVINVTHHVSYAKAVSDRILFMDQGFLLEDKINSEFFTKPSSKRVKLFLQNVDLA
jgi:ABC-type polar amino acid transport system ATPase subunit